MTQVLPPQSPVQIRPIHYRDFEVVERLYTQELEADSISCSIDPDRPLRRRQLRSWQGVLHRMIQVLNPAQHLFCACLSEQDHRVQGVIRVSPFNRTRSTWRVDQVALAHPPASEATPTDPTESNSQASVPSLKPQLSDIGSQLLRYCFEKIWEARTWLLEVNIHDREALALYRQNGFQPLAEITYWLIAPEQLQEIAEREPDLPNLLPVSNADAQLLYQLDTAAMPPLVRQVFDRHIFDFKTSLIGSVVDGVKNWLTHTEVVSAYVFEPQRKAAIGYFQVRLCRDGSEPHQAQLTVHPAYTWLYPELMSQMARITQELPAQALQIASSDYHLEREEYLERVGALRIAHTLMMSRSVWHKVREAKPGALEGLQLAEVLQGLKPARKAIPSRISLIQSIQPPQPDSKAESNSSPRPTNATESSDRGTKPRLNLPLPSEFSDPPQEGPCC
jgi:hypothetical protein